MKTRLLLFLAATVLASSSLQAQVNWQPTPEPTVSAENEPWYQVAEPIMFVDAYYYRAGATVHFNRYQMVRSGAYRGIPIYIDSTLDPYNVIYVPIGHGLLQPYERRREGPLAGTSGSRAPSFPTSIAAEGYVERSPVSFAPAGPAEPLAPEPVSMEGRSIVEAPRGAGSAAAPKGINSVWVSYDDKRWFSAGKAVKLDPSFVEVGTYRGFPVYRQGNDTGTIFLPTAEGMVAPYSITQPKNHTDRNRR